MSQLCITDQENFIGAISGKRSLSDVWSDGIGCQTNMKKFRFLKRKPCERLKEFLQVIYRGIKIKAEF